MNEKVAVITGASSGIGRATARLFATNGASVVAVGRNEKELEILRREVLDEGGLITAYTADLGETSQIDNLCDFMTDNFGQIDVLINAAGILKNGSIENTSLEDWDDAMNVNLRSVFYMMRKCVSHLEKTKGSVVNVSSVTGLRALNEYKGVSI